VHSLEFISTRDIATKVALKKEVLKCLEMKILRPWEIKKHIELLKNNANNLLFKNVEQSKILNIIKYQKIKSSSN
jgi:hypothetical protein